MRGGRTRTPDERGMTLFELIGVLAVMGIVSYTFIVQYSFDATRVSLAEAKLVEDLHYVKTLSLTRGGVYGVSFDPANERYTLFQTSIATPLTDPANPAQNYIVDYASNSNFSGISITSADFGGTATLLFDAKGTPKNGNSNDLVAAGQVIITNGTTTKTIQVAVGTGKVSS